MKRYGRKRAPKPPRVRSEQTPPPAEHPVIRHLGLFVGCVLLPAFFTVLAPLSVIRFTREGEEVRAEISKRVWFVVPYRHLRVEGVTEVDDSFRDGSRNRSSGGKRIRSEDSAALIITGRSGEAEAEISPVDADAAEEKVRAFLDDPSREKLTLVAVANWKFGVFAGGFLSLMTLAYLYGIIRSAVGTLLAATASAPRAQEAASTPSAEPK